MKKIKRAIIGLVFCCFVGTQRVVASEFNFSVYPTIPENQIDKSKTYFDLLLNKGQEQAIEVMIKNGTDKEITVNMVVNPASTNNNGVVEYGTNEINADKTLTYNMKNLVKYDKEVKVPAKGEKTAKIALRMPSEEFKGVIAGGVSFQEKEGKKKETDKEKKKKGMSIENKYSYVVALLMRQEKVLSQPMELKMNKVKATQRNARNVIVANIQNPVSSYCNQLAVEAKVTKKNGKKNLYTAEKIDMQMAPNSNFNFPVPLNGERLKKGKYTMHVASYSSKNEEGKYELGVDENGKPVKYRNKWTFEKDFDITSDIAKKFNNSDVTIKPDYTMYYIIGGLLLLAIIVGIILFAKKKKEEAVRKETKRTKKKKKRTMGQEDSEQQKKVKTSNKKKRHRDEK